MIGQSRDSLISVQDPADLCVYEFPVARCYLYNMGMSDDPVEIIAWDTDEATVESIVDHSMPSNRRGEWRFLARFKDSGPLRVLTMFGSRGKRPMSSQLWIAIVRSTLN